MANLSSLDLNLLRVLDALLQTASTTRAGERIGLSQSAVSAALGRLRHALNDPLFVRQGQRLAPTDFARSLERPLREALDGLERLLFRQEQFDPAATRELFSISGADYFSEALIPQLSARLAREAPQARLRLVSLIPDQNVGALSRADIDLALLPIAGFPEWIDCQPLRHTGMKLIARRGHRRLARNAVAPGETVPLELFCDLSFALYSSEAQMQAIGDRALAALGRRRRVVLGAVSFSAVFAAVEQTELVALVPDIVIAAMGRRYRVASYRAPLDLAPITIGMIWHKRATANPAHRWLRAQVAEILRE